MTTWDRAAARALLSQFRTAEQRQGALDKAREARKARSELLAALKAGTISMTEVLAREDDVAKKTKVAAATRSVRWTGSPHIPG